MHISSSDLTKKIAAQLNVSTKVLAIRPDTLDFIYTQAKAKKVPVKLAGTIQPDRQYYISKIDFSPDSVMAYAPQEILDTLKAAYTENFFWENISDTLKKRVGMNKVKGVKFILLIMICLYTLTCTLEKTVGMYLLWVLIFPAGKVLRTFPSKVQVTFQVGLRHFKDVSSDDFFIGVTYEDVLRTQGDKLPLVVKGSPDFVSHVRVVPSSVDYLIEQQTVEED